MNVRTFFYVLWCACLHFSISFAVSTSSLFIRSVFENGISVNNLTSPTIRGCLANCFSTCSAVKYNPTTRECRLFAHVLLKWPMQANVDAEERSFVKKYPPDVRFQAITADNEIFDWYQSRAVCETLGRNLAIIKTDADMADLNTTVVLSKLHQQETDVDMNKFHLGLIRETAADKWKWYTGEALDVPWPYWGFGEPDSSKDNICARILLWDASWLKVRDHFCENGFPNIVCE